jgi:hypothetical protein
VHRIAFGMPAFWVAVMGIAAAAAGQTRYTRLPAAVARDMPAVHVYVEDENILPEHLVAQLPSNVTISDAYADTVQTMLRSSATFRRQCARLGAARSLTVTVAPTILPNPQATQALTRIVVRRDGSMHAEVNIGTLGNAVELLPHEFEHILEQLDGVDLASLARLPETGVHAAGDGEPFETRRAIAVGRQVAREVREFRRGGM